LAKPGLVPGRLYVVLIAAGGVGGGGATRPEDHGKGGVDGGYGVITDGELFAMVIDDAGAPPVAPVDRDRLSKVTPVIEVVPIGEQLRWAIVDAESGEVDNVVMAEQGFFNEALVRRAVLERRVVRDATGEAKLESRREPAAAVCLRSNEAAAPGWVLRAGVDVRSAVVDRFEPGPTGRSSRVLVGARGGRGAVSLGLPANLKRPSLRILAMATEWFSRHGGLSTLNRDLCRALADDGHEIVCAVIGPSSREEREEARACGVTLLDAKDTSGKNVPIERCLFRPLPLVGGFRPDVILGHGHVSGGAAKAQRDDSFVRAYRVHLLHTKPGESEWYKTNGSDTVGRVEANEGGERALLSSAALAVGVGPRLHSEVRRLIHAEVGPPPAHELVPGLMGDDENRTLPPGLGCLLLGRMEDRSLKGLDIAASAVRAALESDLDVTLSVRGACGALATTVRGELSAILGDPNRLLLHAFDADGEVVRRDILGASVVLMPSRSEGFGLVAWEAMGLAVPVLVSDQSGVAELLRREVPEFSSELIVSITGDDEQTYALWGARVAAVLRDRERAFARAAELRTQLRARFTWSAAVRTLVEKIRLLEPAA
jgi:glycosyltransferase involved in cell wall biosynthesis